MSAPHPKVPEFILIRQADRSVLAVPVIEIARHRAEHYKGEFGDDLTRSLDEDTLPLFTESRFDIRDWAANNMDWSDVKKSAVSYKPAPSLTDADMDAAWVVGVASGDFVP